MDQRFGNLCWIGRNVVRSLAAAGSSIARSLRSRQVALGSFERLLKSISLEVSGKKAAVKKLTGPLTFDSVTDTRPSNDAGVHEKSSMTSPFPAMSIDPVNPPVPP